MHYICVATVVARSELVGTSTRQIPAFFVNAASQMHARDVARQVIDPFRRYLKVTIDVMVADKEQIHA